MLTHVNHEAIAIVGVMEQQVEDMAVALPGRRGRWGAKSGPAARDGSRRPGNAENGPADSVDLLDLLEAGHRGNAATISLGR